MQNKKSKKESAKKTDSFHCVSSNALVYKNPCNKWCGDKNCLPKHGGIRKGAGRKRKESTKTIRIPETLVLKIESMIKKHKSKPFHGFAEERGGFKDKKPSTKRKSKN